VQLADECFNAMVADFLCRRKLTGSADSFAKACNVQDLTDGNAFLALYKILGELEEGKLNSLETWCKMNRARLKELQSDLELRLISFQFVMLVRQDNINEAVILIRSNFLKNYPEQEENAKGLLSVLLHPSASLDVLAQEKVCKQEGFVIHLI